MTNVKPLRQSDISPQMVLEDLLERASKDEIDELYIVTVDREGKLGVAWVGDVAGLSLSAHAMGALVTQSLSAIDDDE
jgi:hypothetical protein